MNSKNAVLRISVFVIALFVGLRVTRAQGGPGADVVTIISNLENDALSHWRINLQVAEKYKYWLGAPDENAAIGISLP